MYKQKGKRLRDMNAAMQEGVILEDKRVRKEVVPDLIGKTPYLSRRETTKGNLRFGNRNITTNRTSLDIWQHMENLCDVIEKNEQILSEADTHRDFMVQALASILPEERIDFSTLDELEKMNEVLSKENEKLNEKLKESVKLQTVWLLIKLAKSL